MHHTTTKKTTAAMLPLVNVPPPPPQWISSARTPSQQARILSFWETTVFLIVNEETLARDRQRFLAAIWDHQVSAPGPPRSAPVTHDHPQWQLRRLRVSGKIEAVPETDYLQAKIAKGPRPIRAFSFDGFREPVAGTGLPPQGKDTWEGHHLDHILRKDRLAWLATENLQHTCRVIAELEVAQELIRSKLQEKSASPSQADAGEN